MAKPGESAASQGLQVRGTVDVEKFKAARALAGDQVTFELRAMRPAKAGTQAAPVACLVCLICIICIVCAAAKAEELGVKGLPPIEG
jgi:hypothetical protein